MRTLRSIFFTLFLTTVTLAADNLPFTPQTIDANIQIGYGLAIGRVDADDAPDILLADKKEIAWYQNPGQNGKPWTKHVIARNLTARDNVCLAARDITGDGLVELAVGANWNPGNTTDAAISGTSFYLKRPTDPTKPWKPIPLVPHEPTTHRMHWLRNASGDLQLAVLPLHGVGNQKAQGKNVMISVFDVRDGKPSLHRKLETGMHATHNFAFTEDDAFGDQEFMVVAGAEGYVATTLGGESLQLVDASLSKGAGEVRRYPSNQRAFVGIEPMHGTDVVLYSSDDGENWEKETLDTTLNQGHALAAGNLFGSASSEVVAGWRGKDAQKRVGIKIYSKSDAGKWTTQLLDDNQIACEDLKLADLNGDNKLDIVACGRATKNVVIYWNESE